MMHRITQAQMCSGRETRDYILVATRVLALQSKARAPLYQVQVCVQGPIWANIVAGKPYTRGSTWRHVSAIVLLDGGREVREDLLGWYTLY